VWVPNKFPDVWPKARTQRRHSPVRQNQIQATSGHIIECIYNHMHDRNLDSHKYVKTQALTACMIAHSEAHQQHAATYISDTRHHD